jgi:hypothetical protein
MKRALHSLENENKGLKELVVRLSETILRHVCRSAALSSLKNTAERNIQSRTPIHTEHVTVVAKSSAAIGSARPTRSSGLSPLDRSR